MRILWWLLRREPESLERARRASHWAGVELQRAQENARGADRLLMENHLTQRFFTEMRRRGAI